jgi:hypothetical protein
MKTMKSIIIIVINLMLCSGLHAQPSGGHFFLGGNIGISRSVEKKEFNGNTYDDITTTSYYVHPKAGIFLGKKFAIGALIGYNGSTNKDPDAELYEYTSNVYNLFSFGPFFRYYIIAGKGGLFVESELTAGIGNTKRIYNEGVDYKGTITQFKVGIAPGVYYSITEKITLEATIGWLGYMNYSDRYNPLFDDDKKNSFNYTGVYLNPSTFSFGSIIVF